MLSVGDIVVEPFIELKEAEIKCDANGHNCKLSMDWGTKIPYEKAIEIAAVGNSGNSAVAAARLGLSSSLVSAVGDDENGKKCFNALHAEKVATDYISESKEYPTNYHYVLCFQAERTILIKHSPFSYILPPDDVEVDWVYFSSIGAHSIDFHDELAQWLEKRPNTKMAFQPGTFQISEREKIKNIYKECALFFCNVEEAQIILGTDSRDIKELHNGLRTWGPKYTVITDGPNGLTASDGEKYYSLPMYPDPKPPIDRTGAGDACSSTITAMIGAGLPFTEALRYGPINSMSVVQYIGAQAGLLSKEKIEEYVLNAPEDYKIKEI